ncbi:MAG: hypothetical protein ACFFCS_28565 [Candidatus Hodarchaeota archaeon]
MVNFSYVIMNLAVAITYGVIFVLIQLKHGKNGPRHLNIIKIGYLCGCILFVLNFLDPFVASPTVPGVGSTIAFISLLLQLPAFISIILAMDELAGGKIGKLPIIIILLIIPVNFVILFLSPVIAIMNYWIWLGIILGFSIKGLLALLKAAPDELKQDVKILLLATIVFFSSVIFWNMIPNFVDMSATKYVNPIINNGAQIVFWGILFGLRVYQKPELGDVLVREKTE